MNINAGLTYKTSGGGIAVVECEHPDEPIYQLSGKLFDQNMNYDRLAMWTTNGRYSLTHQTEFDIASEHLI